MNGVVRALVRACVSQLVSGQFSKLLYYWSEFIAVAVAVEGMGTQLDCTLYTQVQIPPFYAAIGQKDRTDPPLIQQKA